MVAETAPEWGHIPSSRVVMVVSERGKIPSSGKCLMVVSAKCKVWNNIHLKCNTMRGFERVHII